MHSTTSTIEKKKTVLIIEDDASLRKVLADKCKSAGLQVLETDNGVVGLELALHDNPDIILLDLLLPGRSGMSLLKELRSITHEKKIEVIILSNVSGTEIVTEAVEHQVFHYFVKSDVPIDEVMRCIQARLAAQA